jgi:Tfp pilus assembly protein PilZ
MFLSLLDDPTEFKVIGKVIWISPIVNNDQARGVGMQCAKKYSNEKYSDETKRYIEAVVGGASQPLLTANRM